jgi:hypothetical protein
MSVDFWIPGREGEEPWANFANGNARGLIDLLGLPDDGYLSGSVSPQEVHGVLRTIMGALARPKVREGLLRPQRTEQNSRLWDDDGVPTISPGVKVIWSGNTDDQTVRRLETVRDVFAQAAEKGTGVRWG